MFFDKPVIRLTDEGFEIQYARVGSWPAEAYAQSAHHGSLGVPAIRTCVLITVA